MEEIITITPESLYSEHICCAMSDKKCQQGTMDKKDILNQQYKNGYRFNKLNVRGKVFIEYAPSEITLSPVVASDFMQLMCFWVSGKYKGQGWGRKLMESCINDSQEMNGIVAVSSQKKKPFLTDPGILKYFGFEVVDEAPPYFQLYALINKKTESPLFSDFCKVNSVREEGIVVYYSSQCPFTDYYVNSELCEIAEQVEMPLKKHKIETRSQALKAPTAYSTYSVFVNGEFLTHEILSKKRFMKFFERMG